MADGFQIEEPSRPKGMSGLAKFLIGLVVIGGVSTLLCCGGLYYFFTNSMKIAQGPEEIQKLADSIVSIDIPEDFKPEFGMSFNLGIQMQIAAYQAGPDATLVLMQMKMPGNISDEELEAQFELQLNRQQKGKKHDIEVKSREQRMYTIDGVERKFEIVTGTDPESKTEVREIRGVFPGRNGMAFIIMRNTVENWNDDAVNGIINSITAKEPGEPAAAKPEEPADSEKAAEPQEKKEPAGA